MYFLQHTPKDWRFNLTRADGTFENVVKENKYSTKKFLFVGFAHVPRLFNPLRIYCTFVQIMRTQTSAIVVGGLI